MSTNTQPLLTMRMAGRIGEGIWDEQGRLYKLPRWVISNPVNVLEGASAEDDEDEVADEDDIDEEEEGKEGADAYYAELGAEKGKERVPSGANAFTLTARLSDRGDDVRVVIDRDESVKAVLKRVQAEANIEPAVKLRMAYLGRILKETETLSLQGWKQGHVVNVLVFNAYI